jgi:Phage Head-Tail Attachment
VTARFATLESRLTTAVFSHLANAEAQIGGGAPVPGIFDNGYALGAVGIGMAGTQPTITLATASVSGEAVGQTLVVNGSSYYVAAHEPDGTGVSRLLLEVLA